MASSTSSGSDSINKVIARYIPLDRAIMSGNWDEAHKLFKTDECALTAEIDIDGQRPLHIAIGARDSNFVTNLLNMIQPQLLRRMVSKKNWTALHSAAFFGNLEAAKMLVEKDKYLLFIVDDQEHLPIHKAIINFHKDTFDYLLEVSKRFRWSIFHSTGGEYNDPFANKQGVWLLTNMIFAGELDGADELIQKFPCMARTKHDSSSPLKHHSSSPLNSIASKCDAYFSGTTYNVYQRFLYSHIPKKNSRIDHPNTTGTTKCWRSYFYPAIQRIYAKFWELAQQHVLHIKKISEERDKHNTAVMLLERICQEVGKLEEYDQIFDHYYDGFNLAVENDISEAIEVIIRYFPQATWIMCNDYKLSQNAIRNRSEKVYNFLVEKVVNNHLLRTCMDNKDNNLLHLAGMLAPIHKLSVVPGAALQMQREFQWFKEVERFVLPSDKEQKNEDGDIPMMVFRKTHDGLRKDGEEWMKKTADSYTITAALIITIAFAAAITVPGGNSGDTGKAIFERQASFILFVVSDAISLFTSSTSLLLFLSVLTARYREEDFLNRLPTRLILGLVMLFLSMTSMIVAFSATLYLLFGQENTWILIPIAVLTCLPIASFITLQFPLLTELTVSTYGRGIFLKHPRRA